MKINITAQDELTGEQVVISVFDGTSTGVASVEKCCEILAQQEKRMNTLLKYVSHTN